LLLTADVLYIYRNDLHNSHILERAGGGEQGAKGGGTRGSIHILANVL